MKYNRTVILSALVVTFCSLISTSIHAESNADNQLKTCVSINVLISSIAKESHSKDISARNTQLYKGLLRKAPQASEYIADNADIFRGIVKPSLITPLLGHECLGAKTFIRQDQGKVLVAFGKECNSTPLGSEQACTDMFIENIFTYLSPKMQTKVTVEAIGTLKQNIEYCNSNSPKCVRNVFSERSIANLQQNHDRCKANSPKCVREFLVNQKSIDKIKKIMNDDN